MRCWGEALKTNKRAISKGPCSLLGRWVCLAVWITGALLWAEEPDPLLGPLRIRDMMPFSILSLGFMPSGDEVIRKGNVGLSVHFSVANTLIASPDVTDYLDKRNKHEPLSPQEIQNLLNASKGDTYYFDGEIGLVQMEFSAGLTDRLRASLQLPAYSFSGGHLDGFIYGFHRMFGIDQGLRDKIARDDFQMFFNLGGKSAVFAEAPSSGGLGDPTLDMRYDFGHMDHAWKLNAEGAVKIPAHEPQSYLSTGHTDYGMQVTALRRSPENGIYCSLSYVKIGDFGLMPEVKPNDIYSATLSWEHLFPYHWSGVAQITRSRSIFEQVSRSKLGDNEYQISLGMRRQFKKIISSFAVTENVIHPDNTPDIGFHLGFGVLLGQ